MSVSDSRGHIRLISRTSSARLVTDEQKVRWIERRRVHRDATVPLAEIRFGDRASSITSEGQP
jgi:hypothetical protein